MEERLIARVDMRSIQAKNILDGSIYAGIEVYLPDDIRPF
jgi:hypothetical protein